MTMIMLFVLWVLNFGISWWNARAVGSAWLETKAEGGWIRLVAWSGAVMSACGFTWCYLIVLALVGGEVTHVPESGTTPVPYLPPEYVKALLELGYLMIIVPILGSGLVITIHSWREAWRRRTLGSGAVAGWNTFSQVYNTWSAVREVPGIVEHLGSVFKGDNDKAWKWVIILAVLAVFGGILTTYLIASAAMKQATSEARAEILNRSRMMREA